MRVALEGGRVGVERDLDERRTRPVELHEADDRADRHRLLDERGQQLGVETLTSTPQDSLNSHAFFELFTREMTRGTANSCFESQLMTRLSSSSPVAATMTSAAAQARALEGRHLAGVGREDLDARQVPPQHLGVVGVLLEDLHAVAVVEEVRGDGRADAPAASDHDAHQGTFARWSSSSWRASRRTTNCTTSSSWPMSVATSMRGWLLRTTEATLMRPGSSSSARWCPAQWSGQDPLDEQQRAGRVAPLDGVVVRR